MKRSQAAANSRKGPLDCTCNMTGSMTTFPLMTIAAHPPHPISDSTTCGPAEVDLDAQTPKSSQCENTASLSPHREQTSAEGQRMRSFRLRSLFLASYWTIIR